jgi:peptidylamidoglycolate lyase
MKRSVVLVVVACGLAAASVAGMQRQGGTPPVVPPQTNTDLDITSTWFRLPAGMAFGRSVAVTADGKGQILFTRREAEPPIVVFSRDGQYIRGFGTGLFSADGGPHSIGVDRDGFVWATDRNANVVYKFTPEGNVVMTLGQKGVKGDNTSRDAFDGPSNVAVAANGDIFVTDGYGNSRIVKFSRDGAFLKIIGGQKGKEPGQFDLPHAVLIDSKGRLVVTDRNNGRIQIFDQDGTFIEQWTNLGIAQPSGLYLEPDDTAWTNDNASDLVIKVKDGKVIETIRGLGGRPHMIAVDQGVLYETGGPVNELKRIARKKS